MASFFFYDFFFLDEASVASYSSVQYKMISMISLYKSNFVQITTLAFVKKFSLTLNAANNKVKKKKNPSLGQNLGNDYGVQQSNLVVTFC